MITDLFQVINNNKGCVVVLDISSVVNEEVLSSIKAYSLIENALFTGLEGNYEMKGGLSGHSHYEGLTKSGLLINLEGVQQLFISDNSVIKKHKDDGIILFDIKDKYGSMYIRLQVFTRAKVTSKNNGGG